MSQPRVQITVRHLADNVGVIDLAGEVTASAEQALSEAYSAIGTTARAVILNFSQLEYMNSSGIGLLVTLLIRARRHGQQLLAFGLSEHYREIFELTRLNEAILLYSSEADTLAALASAR
jgi:anti-sigma B factor antagonist